jgi:hypothetical protein
MRTGTLKPYIVDWPNQVGVMVRTYAGRLIPLTPSRSRSDPLITTPPPLVAYMILKTAVKNEVINRSS